MNKTRQFLAACIALGMSLLAPKSAEAQLGIETLLKNVTDVGLYGTTGSLWPRTKEVRTGNRGLNEFGFELSFGLGAQSCEAEWRRLTAKDRAGHAHGRPEQRQAEGDSVLACKEPTSAVSPPTTPGTATQRVVTTKEGETTTEITYTLKAPPPPLRDTTWLFELALGYGQFSGFTSRDPAFELRGSVRAAPTISVYATKEHGLSEQLPIHISPYFGLR